MTEAHAKFMKLAIKEARRGVGRTSPNPAVGAVIVREGRVVAQGYHHQAGMPHAEVDAFGKIDNRAPGGTLYVTLEPCNHFGKTPPCTELVLKSGVKRVVVGMRDPNPLVTGGGCNYLEKKGLEVVTGILKDECIRLNEAFIKFISTGRPFVIAKSAITLDGWTATSAQHSQWITNEKSRNHVHEIRNEVDAILVGSGTLHADNPSLTSRIKGVKTKDPIRIVLDTHLSIKEDANLVIQDSKAKTIIVTGPDVSKEKKARFEKKGVQILEIALKDHRLDLNELMIKLGQMSILSLLVEGGSRVAGSALKAGIVNKVLLFFAPKLLGGSDGTPIFKGKGPLLIKDAFRLKQVSLTQFDDDILVKGYLK